jgi:hypothetical protein
MMRAAGIFLAAFAVLAAPGLGGGQAIAQSEEGAETLTDLEAKALQIIIGKTADEIREALGAGPYGEVLVQEADIPIFEDGVQLRPGDLHVIFSRQKKSIFEPFRPRISIIVSMQDGVAVSIERVRSFAK